MSMSAIEKRYAWPIKTYAGKRALDTLCACGILLPLLPLIALIAFAVKATSRGPLFYRGMRAGLAGRPFGQLKFRTMKLHNAGSAFTSKADPRVTLVGVLLRFFKLDELPQCINVLRGEMSIVGPRPEDLSVVDQLYTDEQLRVLSVKPGLTCSLQVRIFPDFTYDVPPGSHPEQHYRQVILPARLQEDLDYIDCMSLGGDIKIILQTIWCILFRSWAILWKRLIR